MPLTFFLFSDIFFDLTDQWHLFTLPSSSQKEKKKPYLSTGSQRLPALKKDVGTVILSIMKKISVKKKVFCGILGLKKQFRKKENISVYSACFFYLYNAWISCKMIGVSLAYIKQVSANHEFPFILCFLRKKLFYL